MVADAGVQWRGGSSSQKSRTEEQLRATAAGGLAAVQLDGDGQRLAALQPDGGGRPTLAVQATTAARRLGTVVGGAGPGGERRTSGEGEAAAIGWGRATGDERRLAQATPAWSNGRGG
ncbi:unnamed protein product [Cuscuta campestris]|uniref:Uncharacterized protein n=1 Tax=Cuscuta campestris TaxID=132261 RepID=A0A484LU56_9ASTE|nr:unnamed protein product [Cuscuta campestris]